PALETLAYHNANLTSLRLDFCGHLDDAAMKVFSKSLPSLHRLELLGPFLVRPAAWQEFFESHPQLQGLLITQSPRFDEECIKALVKFCPGITELRLKEIGQLKDAFLQQIQLFEGGLWYLDLADPSHSCSEEAMLELLRAVGKTLTHLNVSKHNLLTDNFLKTGLLSKAKVMQSLTLSHLPELTTDGVRNFFDKWKGKNPPLSYLDISRNDELKGPALESILGHSGDKLEHLNINGWKDVEEDALRLIGKRGLHLKTLDVGFCRAVDDFVVKTWLEGEDSSAGCQHLQEIKVWGCNRITASCPRKKGVSIFGVESHVVA
ncbi:RNI-like protein, partial [Agrocybe pediades]